MNFSEQDRENPWFRLTWIIERRPPIQPIWIICIVVLWVLVLCESVLLLLLLRGLGELKQRLPSLVSQVSRSPSSIQLSGLTEGELAPDFEAVDQDGKAVRLRDTSGSRRLLAFISPGCAACRGTVEAVNELLQHKSPWRPFLIGSSKAEENRVYATRHNVLAPLLTPAPGVVMDVYKVTNFPLVFLIDEQEKIIAKGIVNDTYHLDLLLAKASLAEPVV